MGGERVPSCRLPGSGFQDNRTQVKVQNWSPSACGLLLWELDEGRWALRVAPCLWLVVLNLLLEQRPFCRLTPWPAPRSLPH